MSWAVASTCPSGGRRSTNRRPSASVTREREVRTPAGDERELERRRRRPSMLLGEPGADAVTVDAVDRSLHGAPTVAGAGRRRANGSAGAADADDLAPVHRRRPSRRAGVRGVDQLTAADVDADVADRAVVEDQVARLGLGLRRRAARRRTAGADWCGRHDAGLRPGVRREAGAVERDARARRRRSGTARRAGPSPRRWRCRRATTPAGPGRPGRAAGAPESAAALPEVSSRRAADRSRC